MEAIPEVKLGKERKFPLELPSSSSTLALEIDLRLTLIIFLVSDLGIVASPSSDPE